MAPGLNPTERGAVRVANAEAARQRIKADMNLPRPPVLQMKNGEMRQDGELFQRVSFVVPENEWIAALSDCKYFGKYVNKLHKLDELTLWSSSGKRRAVCVVLTVDTFAAAVRLHCISEDDIPEASAPSLESDNNTFAIEETLGSGYCIKRVSDGVVVAKNIRSFDLAIVQRRRELENAMALASQ